MKEEDLHRHDGRRLIRESGELFLHPIINNFLPPLIDLVKASKDRANYKEPLRHLGMQVALLKSLQKLEEVSSTGKKQARAESSAELEMQSKRNKYLAKAIKEIADGIAWRTLGYSRFTMRILSQGRYSGHTWGKEGQDAELNKKHTNATILIVAHSGVMVALNASLLGVDFGQHNISEAYPHDYVAKFAFDGGAARSFEAV